MKKITLLVMSTLCFFSVYAKENVGQNAAGNSRTANKTAAACDPATSQVDMDVNNVRTKLLAGGDLWWDLGSARYEIPKVEQGSGEPSRHSLFAGALWIGGLDEGNQLKVAAQTYRQGGNDFWPGPLDAKGSVDDEVCTDFDKHWKVNIADIKTMIDLGIKNNVSGGGKIPKSSIPRSVLEWPGKGNLDAVGAGGAILALDPSKDMAPFVDVDGNLEYNPERGDYPSLDDNNAENIPDQMVWWIYNDKGDIHTETGGEAIGLEIQVTAFAFATNDEVNDMTFYKYKVRNFSTAVLDSVYFGQWVDADLGKFDDDFVGCDQPRALGICYNGDAVDEGLNGYGSNPPIVGVDFFKGPIRVLYDQQGTPIGEEQLGMSKFIYYNNDFSVIGNPEVASHFYGYLSGTWKDGEPITCGGNGRGGTTNCDFMFPDDPSAPLPAWSECSVPNTPADRRFVQSSGPFRLEPGAENEVVVGVVWVRPSVQIGCFADFDAIRIADDKAQALFDNNFKIINGPDAPTLALRELNREILLAIYNDTALSNNAREAYSEVEPTIVSLPDTVHNGDTTYAFQGYKIYQLRDAQVSASEYNDPEKARLIAQFDVEDGVDRLINFELDQTIGFDVPVLKVDGGDAGIKHTLKITEDQFATGDKALVNHKTYYFSAVAYAHNNYLPYDPSDTRSQKRPYLEGRNNITVYSAIPHDVSQELGGTVLNSQYGDGPQIKRIQGTGTGYNFVRLTEESEQQILANGSVGEPLYEKGAGPIDVRVIDPLKVPKAEFILELVDTFSTVGDVNDSARWVLTNLTTGAVRNSETIIGTENEQIFLEWGLSVSIPQVHLPGEQRERNNGLIGSEITFEDPTNAWLTSVPDGEGQSRLNWIRAGSFDNTPRAGSQQPTTAFDDWPANEAGTWYDQDEVYEDVVNGTWAPFPLLSGMHTNDIAFEPDQPTRNIPGLAARSKMDTVRNAEIVFTSDKSLWSRCPVVEMADVEASAQGNRRKLEIRDHASVGKDGLPDGSPNDGMSWFPGYAIDPVNGERLNIFFSENSSLPRGRDMIWNPGDSLDRLADNPFAFQLDAGGMHYIFVHNSRYDAGEGIRVKLAQGGGASLRSVYERCSWASLAMLSTGAQLLPISEGLIPTTTRVKLRVTRPYRHYRPSGATASNPKYWFSTEGLAPESNLTAVAASAMDNIRVVPNPYYSFSAYEKSQLDNRVKITNLPGQCTVSIFSADGTMVRQYEREVTGSTTEGTKTGTSNNDNSLDWDLKNAKNIPVASGMYIIHVAAPGLGEKTVKFFATMRPINLDTF